MSPSRLEHAAHLVRDWVAKDKIQTMVVLVARRGVVVLYQAYGRIGPDADARETPLNAVFGVASITKILTATTLMTLVDEGKVGLNRPVSGYIPEFQGEDKDGVLVRHLLTHTSGLRNAEIEGYVKEHQGRLTVPPSPTTIHPLFHEYLSQRLGCPLWKRPGEEMSYCDYNFDLAAEIVRRVTDTSLDRFARDRVFQPLGMNDSFYCLVDVPPERRVMMILPAGYSPDAMDVAREKERFWMGAGCALSSAMDMAILGQMYLNGGAYGGARVLSPASAAAMTRNQTPGIPAVWFDQVFPESSWGFGWGIEGGKQGWNGALQSPKTYGHLGNGGKHVWVDPERELVVACLSAVPAFVTAEDFATTNWAKHWRNDLFADAVTAAVEED